MVLVEIWEACWIHSVQMMCSTCLLCFHWRQFSSVGWWVAYFYLACCSFFTTRSCLWAVFVACCWWPWPLSLCPTWRQETYGFSQRWDLSTVSFWICISFKFYTSRKPCQKVMASRSWSASMWAFVAWRFCRPIYVVDPCSIGIGVSKQACCTR